MYFIVEKNQVKVMYTMNYKNLELLSSEITNYKFHNLEIYKNKCLPQSVLVFDLINLKFLKKIFFEFLK